MSFVKQSFELSDYVIQFKSVLLVPEIAQAFYHFLKQEYATDNWDFILEVNKLQELAKKKNPQRLLKHAKNIFATYIETSSPKEILIGKTQKKFITEEIKKLGNKNWNLKVAPNALFEGLKNLVMLEYKNDSFKRFSKEPDCLKLLEKYKKNRNVLLPQLSMVFNYKDEDFDITTTEKKDIAFLDRFILDNPNWQLIFTDKNQKTSAFTSKWNYLPNVSFLSDTYLNIKYQMTFDYSLQEVACVLFSGYQYNDPLATDVRTIEYKNKSHVIFQQTTSVGALKESRFKRLIYTVDYDPEEKVLSVRAKPTRIPGAPFLKSHNYEITGKNGEVTGKTKGIQYFTYYIYKLTAVGEKKTLVEQVIAGDVGGKGISNSLAEKRLLGITSNLHKKLKELGDRTKIKDFKYEFNDLWEGIPNEPLGKLIYDLDIDSQDEEHQKKMDKRNQVFDLSNFAVNFTAIRKRDVEIVYYNFLKSETNTISWDFIIDFLKLLKLQARKKEDLMDMKLSDIVKTYFDKGARKNLMNLFILSTKDIKSVLATRHNSTRCIDNLKKIYGRLKLEHQLDSFKRFQKTPEAKEVLSKYQHDPEVMSPILECVTIYKTEDFQNTIISDKDLHFSTEICGHASTWDQIYSDDYSTISISKVNWFQDCKFITPTLVSFELKYKFNYPIEQVVNGYLNLSKFNTVDPNISKVKCINHVKETNESYESVVLNFDMVWLWNTSFIKENVCTLAINENQLFFISKPIQPKDQFWFKKEDDNIKYFQYEIIALTKNTDTTTTFQHIICINSNEKIEWDKKMIERTKGFYVSVESSIANSPTQIVDMKEKYENEEPLGKLLLSLDLNDCQVNEVSESEEDTLSSRYDIRYDSNTTFDDDELTSNDELTK
eukprot:gene1473-12091_t